MGDMRDGRLVIDVDSPVYQKYTRIKVAAREVGTMPAHTVYAERLNASLDALGRIGETPQGIQRVAYSALDVEGRAYVMGLMRQAGLSVRVDPAGNIIGRLEGRDPSLPAVAMGSHVDTVPNGGKYDGALGSLSAIEMVRTLNDLGIVTRHPVEVLVFTNEEGTTFHRWLLGSRAMAGLWEEGDFEAVDGEGVGMAERLKAIGGDMSRLGEAGRSRGELEAYLELQGPVLHRESVPVGVVTGITGRAVFQVRVAGAANHAGTTPMDARRDALLAASRLTLAVNSIVTQEEVCRVGTVGTVTAKPGAVNVIPGEVELGVEFRDIEMASLGNAERRLNEVARELGSASGTEIEVRRLELGQSCTIGTEMQKVVAEAARRLGLASRPIPSGAGHDAQAMATITQSGMIFVPSVNGISHSPHEYTTREDCANGASVLLNALLILDEG